MVAYQILSLAGAHGPWHAISLSRTNNSAIYLTRYNNYAIDTTSFDHGFIDLAPQSVFHNGQDPSRSSTEQAGKTNASSEYGGSTTDLKVGKMINIINHRLKNWSKIGISSEKYKSDPGWKIGPRSCRSFSWS